MSERRHRGPTVRREIHVEADPRAVYEAWADPEKLARWFVDRAEGRAEAGKAQTWHFEGFGSMPIPIVEALPGERVVAAGEVPGGPPFLFEVLLEAEGGGTRVSVANSGFGEGPDADEQLAGTDSGWAMALGQLKRWLEWYPDSERGRLLVREPAAFEYATLQRWFDSPQGLDAWLTAGADVRAEHLDEGVEVHMPLRGGGALSGDVLVRTRREVLLPWPERRAVLGLKAFQTPAGREVALDLSAWPLPDSVRGELTAQLRAALARLTEFLAEEAEAER